MNINSVNSQFASYSFNTSQSITKEQASQIIEAGNKIQQAPSTQKLANQVNKSIERTKIDIMA